MHHLDGGYTWRKWDCCGNQGSLMSPWRPFPRLALLCVYETWEGCIVIELGAPHYYHPYYTPQGSTCLSCVHWWCCMPQLFLPDDQTSQVRLIDLFFQLATSRRYYLSRKDGQIFRSARSMTVTGSLIRWVSISACCGLKRVKEVHILVLIFASKWIRVGVIFPHLVALWAIHGIWNAALAKGLLNELVWSVFPGFGDPIANLRQFHVVDLATCSKGVLLDRTPL